MILSFLPHHLSFPHNVQQVLLLMAGTQQLLNFDLIHLSLPEVAGS